MFDEDNILKSPREVAQDESAFEPLRLLLEDPHRERLVKLRFWTLASFIFVVAAGVVIWGWAYFGGQRDNPGFWHVSLVSVLFWLSITQGLVALSALLRLTHASWRYPLNRLLDMASLFGVWGVVLVPYLIVARGEIYNLGVSDYHDNVWRVAGPNVWDHMAVGTAYLSGAMLLFLTSLPDFAVLRDRAAEGTKERKFYGRMTNWRLLIADWKHVRQINIGWLGAITLWRPTGFHWENFVWTGAEHQWRVLRRAEGVLIVASVVTFVASQTVLGWDFQLAAARDWDSSIFAPLFTLGSLLGALAAAILVMTVVARLLRGHGFFRPEHYDNIGKFMIGLGLVWFYFRFCDYLTAWYGHIPDEWQLENDRTRVYPVMVGLMVFGCFLAPVFGNFFRSLRRIPAYMCTLSVFVLLGLAAQRYLDTVPTFALKWKPSYLEPTIPGFVVFLGLAGMFALTYLFFARTIPIMSWWGTSKERTRTAERQMGNATVTVMVEDPPVWET